MSASPFSENGVKVMLTAGTEPPMRKERVADFGGELELLQCRFGEFAAKPRVLLPLPVLAAHVGQRGKILREEPVDHAVGREHPGEILHRHVVGRCCRRRDSGSTITSSQALLTVSASIWFNCAIDVSGGIALEIVGGGLEPSATAALGSRDALARRLKICSCRLALARSVCDGMAAANARL